MEVTLNKNSWHYALNRWSLEREPQTWSLCPYFWMTIWHIVSAPFRAVGRYLIVRPIEWIFVPRGERSWEDKKSRTSQTSENKINRFLEKSETVIRRGLGGLIIGLFLIMFFGLLAHGIMKDGWKAILLFSAVIASGILITLGIGLISMIASRFGSTDAWTAIKGMFYSIKNKVCPAINWTDKQSNHVNN